MTTIIRDEDRQESGANGEEIKMSFLEGNIREITIAIILFIVIFFLFRLGAALAKNEIGKWVMPAWLLTLSLAGGAIAIFVNVSPYGSDNKILMLSILGFVPILTYIILMTTSGINQTTSVKVKGVLFSGVASAMTYMVTHSVFNFGIPEASLSAVVAAVILGAAGYSA